MKNPLKCLSKINWKVRAKNALFRVQVATSILVPILADMGVNAKELTTWGSVGGLIVNAVKNPVVVFAIVIGLLHAISDPTTEGFSDSKQALKYTEPRKED